MRVATKIAIAKKTGYASLLGIALIIMSWIVRGTIGPSTLSAQTVNRETQIVQIGEFPTYRVGSIQMKAIVYRLTDLSPKSTVWNNCYMVYTPNPNGTATTSIACP